MATQPIRGDSPVATMPDIAAGFAGRTAFGGDAKADAPTVVAVGSPGERSQRAIVLMNTTVASERRQMRV
jgi:hypothetical protein